MLRSFAAENGYLQPLDDAIAAAVAGARGRACDNTPITVKVCLWRHLSINDYAVEQQLFKAYIRSRRFEKLNEQDATYVRIQCESGAGDVIGGFAHINYFPVHDDDRRSRMLANMDIISTACVGVRLVRDAALVRGAARGRGRRAGASTSASKVRHGRGRGASSLREAAPSQSAVLFKLFPGRETAVVGVDAIVALMGIVYCEQGGYLVRRDSYFYPPW